MSTLRGQDRRGGKKREKIERREEKREEKTRGLRLNSVEEYKYDCVAGTERKNVRDEAFRQMRILNYCKD